VSTLKKHPHVVHPKELIIKELKGISKFNYRLAVKITNGVGTMWCAYAFLLLDLLMLPPVIKSNDVIVWVTYIAQTVLQLVLLPIIMVGQNVIQAQNESKAETDHNTLTYLATLQDEQMQELKNQTAILEKLQELPSKK
jgi:cobalamin biosynthesis protein CobD/CbiB